jgi:hypothetical protein
LPSKRTPEQVSRVGETADLLGIGMGARAGFGRDGQMRLKNAIYPVRDVPVGAAQI